MIDAVGDFVADRNPRVDESLADAGVGGVVLVSAQVHQNPHRHAGSPSLDDLARVPPVGHEPHRHIQPDILGSNHAENSRAAILVGVVAQPLLGGGRQSRRQEKEGCNAKPMRPAESALRAARGGSACVHRCLILTKDSAPQAQRFERHLSGRVAIGVPAAVAIEIRCVYSWTAGAAVATGDAGWTFLL